MKKKLLIMTIIAAAAALGACSASNSADSTENTTSQVPQLSEEVSQTEEESEDTSAQEVSENGEDNISDEDADKIETKILNSTGKTIDDVNIKSDSFIIGLGSIDDGASVSKKIEKDVSDAKLEFNIDGETTRLPLEDGFQGFKLVITADDADGYAVGYDGIDEED